MDMRLEVVVRPVSDVDRAKELYVRLGWRLDADFVAGDDFRVAESWRPWRRCASTALASRKCTSPPSGNSTSHPEGIARRLDCAHVLTANPLP